MLGFGGSGTALFADDDGLFGNFFLDVGAGGFAGRSRSGWVASSSSSSSSSSSRAGSLWHGGLYFGFRNSLRHDAAGRGVKGKIRIGERSFDGSIETIRILSVLFDATKRMIHRDGIQLLR